VGVHVCKGTVGLAKTWRLDCRVGAASSQRRPVSVVARSLRRSNPARKSRQNLWIATSAALLAKTFRACHCEARRAAAIQSVSVGAASSQRRSELVIAKPVGLRQSSRFLSAAPPRKDARFLSLRGVYDEAYMDAHICQAFNS